MLDERCGAADAWLPLQPPSTAIMAVARRSAAVDADRPTSAESNAGLRLYRED
jgi:hypothetical protein